MFGFSTLCTKSIFLSAQHTQGLVMTAAAQWMSRCAPPPPTPPPVLSTLQRTQLLEWPRNHLPSLAPRCLHIPEEIQGTQILAAGLSPAGTGNFFLGMPELGRGQRKGGLSLTQQVQRCPCAQSITQNIRRNRQTDKDAGGHCSHWQLYR